MKVTIENRQDKVEVTKELKAVLRKAVKKTFEKEGFLTPSLVSFILADDEGIREMNKEFRRIDKATDVLSFPMTGAQEGRLYAESGDYDLNEGLLILGDIVISLETAKRQAEEHGLSFESELAFLAIHGLFHLLGYDHENRADEERILGKQEEVLNSMGLGKRENEWE